MTQDQIRASFQIKENSITPNLIDYSGSAPTDEQSLVYDAGADKFKWTTISGSIGDHTHIVLPSVTVTGTLTLSDNLILPLGDSSADTNIVWYSGGSTILESISAYRTSDKDYLDIVTPNNKNYSSFINILSRVDGDNFSNAVLSASSSSSTAFVNCWAEAAAATPSKSYVTIAGERVVIQGLLDIYNNGIQFRTVNAPTSPYFSNGGTLFVSSGILKLVDYNSNTTNIVTTTDSDYAIIGGWTKSFRTWTYASASTFTIAGDVTSIYTKGAKIKWTQTTVKYGVVASSSYSAPNTTITIIVNSDYTVANAAITDNYYSYQDSPAGFPSIFNYTPTWSTSGTQPSLGDGTLVGAWSVRGGYIRYLLQLTLGSSTTTGTGTMIFSIPRNSATAPVVTYWGNLYIFDADTSNRYHRLAGIGNNQSDFRYSFASNSLATTYQTTVTDPITFAQSDIIALDIEYVFI